MAKIKVGVLDNHLNNWHADTFLNLLRGPLADREIEITAAYESDPVGEDWCAKNGIKRAATPEEALDGMDAIMVLSPDNIEDHLAQCKVALPYGKPTLVDKFLAPTLTEAKEIASLANQYKTPIFSSSSLRFAVELDSLISEIGDANITESRFTGMGRWEIYGVHTLCMALRVMGPNVLRVIDTGTDTAHTVTLDYGNGSRCVLDVRSAEDQYAEFPWSIAVRVGDKYHQRTVHDHDGFYLNLMRQTADFFSTDNSPIAISESIATVAVIEAGLKSYNLGSEWVSI